MFGTKFAEKIRHAIYVQYTFYISLMCFEIVKQKQFLRRVNQQNLTLEARVHLPCPVMLFQDSVASALDGVGQDHATRILSPGKGPRFKLVEKLGGPQSRFEHLGITAVNTN
jgi:hypothetical protein